MGRALVALAFASLLVAAGCLSSSSSEAPRAQGVDASTDAGSFIVGGGTVNVDGGASVSAEGGAGAHAGFAVLAGGVRASSSAHVIITTTGEAPGGAAPMHSTAHTIVGGIVGGTQKP